MLPTLCLVTNLDNEFIGRQGIPHISLFVVALRRDVVEHDLRLLNERAFHINALGCVKAKLFFEFGLSNLSGDLLFLYSRLLLGIELLDQRLLTRLFLSAHFKSILILVIATIADPVGQIGSTVILRSIPVLILLVYAEEVLTLDGRLVTLILLTIVTCRDRF